MFLEFEAEKEVSWSYGLVDTTTIEIEKFDGDIVSLIEHPFVKNKILVATENQLIEFDENGKCMIIAGEAVPNCDTFPNEFRFHKISNVIPANFERVNGSAASALVADTQQDCIISFEWSLSSFQVVNSSEIGNCFDQTVMNEYVKYGLNQIELTEPNMVSAAYYDNLVRLFINCRASDSYLVVVSFYSTDSFGYAYFPNSKMIVLAETAPFGVLRLDPQNDQCVLRWFEKSVSQTYSYHCPSASYVSFQIHQINSQMLMIFNNSLQKLELVDQNTVSSKTLKLDFLSENISIDLFGISKKHVGGIWIYSKANKAFYLMKLSQQTINHDSQMHSIEKLSENNQCCEKMSKEITVQNLEVCVYLCVKERCVMFSYNTKELVCSICATQKNDLGKYELGVSCYHRVPIMNNN